jgi:hypothetical protein
MDIKEIILFKIIENIGRYSKFGNGCFISYQKIKILQYLIQYRNNSKNKTI